MNNDTDSQLQMHQNYNRFKDRSGAIMYNTVVGIHIRNKVVS